MKHYTTFEIYLYNGIVALILAAILIYIVKKISDKY